MYIFSPLTRKKIFLDNGISDYKKRLEVVYEKVLIDEIVNYCRQNSYIKNNRQVLSYETAEHILENLATYLLLGQYKKNKILTIYQIRQYNMNEVQASNSNTNAEDLIYGTSDNEGNTISITATKDIKAVEIRKDIQEMSFEDIKKYGKKDAKYIKKYNQSKSYRMEKIYSTKPIRTYRWVQVMTKNEQGKEVAMRNVYKQPIWDVQYLTIGDRHGIINAGQKYYAEWCQVDTDGEFIFGKLKFRVDMQEHPQYTVREDNECDMDKILCYYIPEEDRMFFFDQEIQELQWVQQV